MTRSSKFTAVMVVLVIAFMVGLTAASVPLYRLFCQVTGFGGTPRIESTENSADVNPAADGRMVEVRFDVNLGVDAHGKLPNDVWDFRPPAAPVTIKLGQAETVIFTLTNKTSERHGSTSTFNVTPLKAGVNFVKTQCFCFEEQFVEPKATVEMPVVFYIDKDMAKDKTLDDVKTITLSYTLYDQGVVAIK